MVNITQGKANNMAVHLFAIGTGRSGTHSIAKLLNGLPGCSVLHEKEPQLLQEGADYLSGKMPQKDMVDLLRQTRSVESIGGERLSGESNQRLSFVLPALVEAFPEARYIWMIRDGRSVVCSYVNRKKYHRHTRFKKWELHADQIGEMSSKEWELLDAFGRCCWFWAYTNNLIKKEAERLNLKLRLCKLENIDNDLPDIFSLLELDDQIPKRAPRSNVTTSYKLPWRFWSPNQRAIFKEITGPVMDEHYPGWLEEMQVSSGQEINSFLHRFTHGLSSSVRYHTRPLREKLGLIRQR